MAAYQLTLGTAVIRKADYAYILADPQNADWQAYQAWLAAGNIPDPAPVTTISPKPVPPVAVPNNAAAAAAGVAVGGFYMGATNPAQVFIRTA